jgi:hypothetical protein
MRWWAVRGRGAIMYTQAHRIQHMHTLQCMHAYHLAWGLWRYSIFNHQWKVKLRRSSKPTCNIVYNIHIKHSVVKSTHIFGQQLAFLFFSR